MIRDAILSGDLTEEESIPSVRQVSVEHGLNPQTVLNATRLLIEEGVLEKRRGIGIFVKKGARQTLLKTELKRFHRKDIPAFVERARLLGLKRKELSDSIHAQFKEDGHGVPD